MTDEIKQFWQAFCRKHNLALDTPVEVWAFGDSQAMADDLAQLVDQGIKTATTSAFELYQPGEHVPAVGEYNIILDGRDHPVCVTRTEVVYIVPYNQVTPEHAYHEGEGDRSLAYWRQVHTEFFQREFREEAGKEFYEQAPMLCEVFKKID